jgi:hypothetical protein
MERAQAAVTAVLQSQVDLDGLLDDIANDVTLPAQQYEIAQRLAELTRLARKVRTAAGDASGSRVEEVLRTQRQALRLSSSALEERVEALERYAENTRAADAAYREWEAVRELEQLGEDMHELVANTVRDELAVAEIEGLADRSRLQDLHRMLDEAREAGLPPAHLRPPHQVGEGGGVGQVRDPVAGRGVLAVRPFDQEGPGGQDAVPPAAAAACLLDRCQGLLARRPHCQHRES